MDKKLTCYQEKQMTNNRKVKMIKIVDDDQVNKLVMVVWNKFCDGKHSYSYEQFYPKGRFEQFKKDVGEIQASSYQEFFK